MEEVEVSQKAYTLDGEVLNGPEIWIKYPASMIYKTYCAWCTENGVEPKSQTTFGLEIKKTFGFKTIHESKGPFRGKRFYIKADL